MRVLASRSAASMSGGAIRRARREIPAPPVGKIVRTSACGSPWSLSAPRNLDMGHTPRLDLCANLQRLALRRGAALAPLATSTSSDTSELLAALVRRARKSLRLVFARPLGAAQLVPPFEEALRRRTGRPPTAPTPRWRAGSCPTAGCGRTTALARVPRRRRDDRGHAAAARHRRRAAPYSTWTVEDAAGWEACRIATSTPAAATPAGGSSSSRDCLRLRSPPRRPRRAPSPPPRRPPPRRRRPTAAISR